VPEHFTYGAGFMVNGQLLRGNANFSGEINYLPYVTSREDLIEHCSEDHTFVELISKVIITIIICLITFPSDWSCIATMAILAIGTNSGNFKKQMAHMMLWTVMYAIVYFVFIDKVYAFIQLGTCLTIPLLQLYNGKRGSMKGIGKLFYVYYPLHLFICGIIRMLLWGAEFSTGTANF